MKTFISDFRSPPSGLGQVFGPNGPEVNITSDGCGLSGDLPNITVDYPYDSSENLTHYIQILKSLGVTSIKNSEMAYDHGLDSDSSFTLDHWETLVRSEIF